jgi:hypothetical protein
MDRPSRVVTVPSLAWMLVVLGLGSAGCRSTRSEVPPGKPYQTTGGTPPTVGFSSEPHPSSIAGMAGLYGNKAPNSFVQNVQGSAAPSGDVTYGVPNQGAANLGAPTDNRFGPPGTSGTAGAGSGASGPSSIANSMLKAVPPASKMLEKDPDTVPGGANSSGGAYP